MIVPLRVRRARGETHRRISMIPNELASRTAAIIATMIPMMYGNTFMIPPQVK